MNFRLYTSIATFLFLSQKTFAFSDSAWSVGLGYYSQNSINKTASSESGSTSLLGDATFFPVTVKYDYRFGSEWFLAPQLSYSVLARSAPGDTAKVSLTHLIFQFGQNYAENWDWYIGPGYLRYDIVGSGGTSSMSNGTGTATFAVPDRSSTIQKISLNLGTSYKFNNSSVGLNLIFENPFSSTKRSQNLMINYAYYFTGGYF